MRRRRVLLVGCLVGSGAYTMKQIAEAFGVHYMTVIRAVRCFEAQDGMLEC